MVVLVPAALYPLAGPWSLLWVPAALAAAAALVLRERSRAPAVPAAPSADGSPDDARTGPRPASAAGSDRARDGRRIRPVALPSAADDYDLYFSAVVHWRWSNTVDLRLRNPLGPAVLSVVTRAAELVRETDPADEGMTECELAARLAVEHAVIGSGIAVWAEEVSLRSSEADAERLRRMADLRKDRVVREAARVAEDDLAPLPAARLRRAPDDGALLPVPADPAGRPDAGGLDGFEGFDGPDAPGEHAPVPAGPGSDVDVEGYESYWWPAEEDGDREGSEEDVQVAILRGMIDALAPGDGRDAFVRDQVAVLERGGFDGVARRIRAGHPDPGDP
ncbi:hypothetical protein [Nocardiopsis flavescens]|uniref:hypothetical protein n=1 Tax=Nocardiopsis flavescens TaxID=758803 RepID=UPI001FE7E5FF|nr:hypothetical protein [Nocardiopsis flavescens]